MRISRVLFVAALALAVAAPVPASAHHRGNSTAYCLQGRGGWVHTAQRAARDAGHLGVVAVPRPGRAGYFPLGTVLTVSDGPYGGGSYVVADRIGWGSQLDFAMPGDCRGARTWGRRAVDVRPA